MAGTLPVVRWGCHEQIQPDTRSPGLSAVAADAEDALRGVPAPQRPLGRDGDGEPEACSEGRGDKPHPGSEEACGPGQEGMLT